MKKKELRRRAEAAEAEMRRQGHELALRYVRIQQLEAELAVQRGLAQMAIDLKVESTLLCALYTTAERRAEAINLDECSDAELSHGRATARLTVLSWLPHFLACHREQMARR